MLFRHGPYQKRSQPPSWSKFILPVGNLPLMICSKQGVSCHVCFNVVSAPGNRRYTLAIQPIAFTITHRVHELNLRNIKILTRSFKIFGKWSVQANIHTHARNKVTLVWGSLRLVPISTCKRTALNWLLFYSYLSLSPHPPSSPTTVNYIYTLVALPLHPWIRRGQIVPGSCIYKVHRVKVQSACTHKREA